MSVCSKVPHLCVCQKLFELIFFCSWKGHHKNKKVNFLFTETQCTCVYLRVPVYSVYLHTVPVWWPTCQRYFALLSTWRPSYSILPKAEITYLGRVYTPFGRASNSQISLVCVSWTQLLPFLSPFPPFPVPPSPTSRSIFPSRSACPPR